MNELEELGVLAEPEDVGVKVKNVSPRILVKKGEHDHRFVIAHILLKSMQSLHPFIPPSATTESYGTVVMVWCLQAPQSLISQYFQLLSPLETATSGQDCSGIVNWTDKLFHKQYSIEAVSKVNKDYNKPPCKPSNKLY